MAAPKMWMVRAGRKAVFADEFREQSHVAMAWNELGELPKGIGREELAVRYAKVYAAQSKGRAAVGLGQVFRFHTEMKVGDLVCTYDSDRRTYLIGEITSEPYMRDHVLKRVRNVQWTSQVLRDSLTGATRNSLGSIMTLFLVSDEAFKELRAKSQQFGSEPDGVQLPDEHDANLKEESEESVELADVATKADEFIEDRIAQLDWEEMQEMVAGILRAMGYRTQVSAKGPDRGVDIFASPDGLGLQEPRIFVEVKHRMGQAMGASEIRAFLGGRQAGDRCLYVSTGGFSKDARYEAERSAIPVTLVSLPRLRELLVEHYDRLDPTTTSLVPLERLYWPAD